MNEQVKSLANIWANRRSEDDKLGIVYTFTAPALEQFAELIVKECFTKLTPYMDDQFINDIEEELNEHFGIKE